MNAAKLKYFKKVYESAPLIECACGCKTQIKSMDRYARPVKYVSGHNNRKYDDPTQYKREWNHKNRKARFNYKQLRSRRMKSKFITRLGSSCSDCGLKYDGKNACVFQFHHIVKPKIFGMNLASFQNRTISELETELWKCKLLCANCHFKVHSSEY